MVCVTILRTVELIVMFFLEVWLLQCYDYISGYNSDLGVEVVGEKKCWLSHMKP